MIWLAMLIMCLYGVFGDETWLPEWLLEPEVLMTVTLLVATVGAIALAPEWAVTACWLFACLLTYIGATRPGWKQ